MGRVRKQAKNKKEYQNRIIDIDILFYEDEVKNSKNLHIPHPYLQKRLFVLQPLVDIAKDYEHPVFNKNINMLLLETEDQSTIELISEKLNNPSNAICFDHFNFISIEGNIGAGKTTLSTMIAEDYNAKLILERFKDNPFLPKFYKDQERFAFPLEMSFLADRYQQLLDDLGQYDLFKKFMISDYDSYKSLIFAQITLSTEEFALYKKLYSIMYKDITKPDIYIYLHQNTDRLLENIKKRGRSYEQDISKDYLIKINQGYSDFIRKQQHFGKVKVLDISDKDFVKSREDYINILKNITDLE